MHKLQGGNQGEGRPFSRFPEHSQRFGARYETWLLFLVIHLLEHLET